VRADAAFVTAMHVALLTAAGAALVAAIVVLLLLAMPGRSSAGQHAGTSTVSSSAVADRPGRISEAVTA
jgi:hypothetical protein